MHYGLGLLILVDFDIMSMLQIHVIPSSKTIKVIWDLETKQHDLIMVNGTKSIGAVDSL